MQQKIDRYIVKEEIGRGGMSVVYLAHDPRFERDVAIKVLPQAFLHDPTFRQRFQREAKAIAALEHPAIVPVYDFGDANEQPFLVMRHMSGGSLAQRLTRGPLSLSQTIAILSRIAPALDRAHSQGMVHRDIKPDNILFDQDGAAYLTDFGIVRLTSESTPALTGDGVIGTPAYMSPEQARGDAQIDGRSDIYSLGVVLFEMLTVQTPYQAETAMGLALKHVTDPTPSILRLRPELPLGLESIIRRALSKNPHRRFPDATTLAQAVTAAQKRHTTSLPQSAAAPPVAPSDQTAKGSRVPVIIAAALALALLITCIVAATWLANGRQQAIDATPEAPPLQIPPSSVAGAPGTALPATQTPTPDERSVPPPLTTPQLPPSVLPLQPSNAAQIRQLVQLGQGSISDLRLSPDRQFLAVAGGTGVYVYTLEQGELISHLDGHSRPVRSITWSPDGQRLASAADDGEILIWHVASQQVAERLTGHEDWVRAIAWSPDGSRLASGGNDRTIRIWQPGNEAEALRLQEHSSSVRAIAWSEDGSLLATTANDGEMIIWQTNDGTPFFKLAAHNGPALDVSWSPEGTLLASAGADGVIHLWNGASGAYLRSFEGHSGLISTLDWTANGTRLASGGEDSSVRIWEVPTGNELRNLQAHTGLVVAVEWLGDGRHLLSAGEDGSVQYWDAVSGEPLWTRQVHSAPVNAVAWSPDGANFCAGGTDRLLHCWSAGDLSTMPPFESHSFWVSSVSWSPDGARILSSDFNGRVYVWRATSGDLLSTYRHGATIVNVVRWSPDGDRWASAGNDGRVLIWEGEEEQPALELTHQDSVETLEWAADGNSIAVGSDDGAVHIWDMNSGEETTVLQQESDILALSWGHAPNLLAAGAENGSVVIWDVANGEQIFSLNGHLGLVSALAWSPTANLLVSGGFDGQLIIWDTTQGEQLYTLHGHRYAVWDAKWSMDGRLILSGSGDGTTRLWGVPDN